MSLAATKDAESGGRDCGKGRGLINFTSSVS